MNRNRQLIVKKWESEGYLIDVPDDLKEEAAIFLENKRMNCLAGKDYKDSQDDFENALIDFLNRNI